ncbi:MAG: hypothetical protein KF764_04425 [Labilithrix sp.]|nr:hypothetical protein [Labilithrix sp.]
MLTRRSKLRGVLVIVPLVAAASCDRAPTRGPSDVLTRSASVGPEARSSSSRTVDAAGFVDNGGRTSNETARTEMSGMRATETGAERLTGTPGVGLPLPIEPAIPPRPAGERTRPPPPSDSATAGAPTEAVVAGAAQALCERERACGRVGTGALWASANKCLVAMRPLARSDLARTGCPDSFAPTPVASCLSAIRGAACDQRVDGLGALEECEARSICIER